jgi:predicted ATPase
MKSQLIRRCLAASALLAPTLLGACAEPSPPTAEIRNARDAIAQAEENGARTLAPEPLQMAENKLGRAEAAVKVSDMKTAEYLAEEAGVDANLASSSANAQRVSNTANELQGARRRIEPGQ